LLPVHVLSQFEFTFVGGFQYSHLKAHFEERIEELSMVKYLGAFIGGEDKKLLYASTHIFCLPTFYPYEGQPISILEAYASGCAVLTTPHAGIPDIFRDDINGFEIQPNSAESIASCLCTIVSDRNRLIDFAMHNIAQATKFNLRDSYKSKVAEIFHLDQQRLI
jgi:glycosyltransferase involved in cell wall biosynthesis